jgi:hypothetical protein
VRHARRKRQVIGAFALALALLAPRIARAEEPDGVRIAAEAGGGVLGAGVGFIGGLAFGAAACGEGGLGCIGAAMFGGAVGATGGLGLGTWVGGNIADGNGGIGYTYLGELGGLLALTIVVGVASELDIEPPPVVTVLGVLALPIGGAILGYELSHDDDEATGSSGAPLVVTVPVVF